MPGLHKDELSVEVVDGPDGQTLEIAGGSREPACPQAAAEAPGNQAGAPDVYPEAGYAKFARRVPLSQHVDASTLEAKYHDGLLVVKMVKSTKVERKRIAIG